VLKEDRGLRGLSETQVLKVPKEDRVLKVLSL
jgi:hypothetical protein